MPLSDGALAVACYKVEDGRVVLLHTEVPQELSGLGYGSRLAHGVFEALRCDGKRVIVKCPFMSSYAARPRVRHTLRRLIADGPDAGAHSAFGRRYLTPIECMSKGNFQFRGLRPILKSTGLAEHAAASTLIEAIAPSRRAARAARSPP